MSESIPAKTTVEDFRVAATKCAAHASAVFVNLARDLKAEQGREMTKVEMINFAEEIVNPVTVTEKAALKIVRMELGLGNV